MAKVAVLVPHQEMVEMVNAMIGGYRYIVPMSVEYVHSLQVEARARELERQGCELIIARGLYAKLVMGCVKLPVVEIRVTSQALAALTQALRAELGASRPRIALVGFANMLCDTSGFNDLFDVDFAQYPVEVEPGEAGSILENTSKTLRDAVSLAVREGAQAVIGGNTVCARARELSVPCRFVSSGKESLKNALDIAERVGYAIDLEKRNSAEMDAMLNHTFNGIMRVDAAGVALRVNRAMLSLLRRAPGDVLGHGVTGLLPGLKQETLDAVLREGKEAYAVPVPIHRELAVVNIVPVQMEGEITGAILTFQEGQRLIDMDSELRRELYLQGYVARFHFDQLPARSAEGQRIMELASRMARFSAPVLLTGEWGTGKHILAECIHNASAARANAFIPLDCSAYHPDTLDTMMFGNHTTRKDTPACLTEIAQGGTIYLAHVDALSQELQYKLLNLIRGSFIHNGSNRPSAVSVRIIASTDVNLVTLVEQGAFRSDLYYALNVFGLTLPPLRRRREDILGWVEYYLGQWQKKYERRVSLTQGARQYLEGCDWPGNLDQINSVCERIVLLTERRSVDEGFLRRQMEAVAPMVAPGGEQVIVFKDRRYR